MPNSQPTGAEVLRLWNVQLSESRSVSWANRELAENVCARYEKMRMKALIYCGEILYQQRGGWEGEGNPEDYRGFQYGTRHDVDCDI